MVARSADSHSKGETPVSLGYDRVRFLAPVFFGDTMNLDYRIAGIDVEPASVETLRKVQTGEVPVTTGDELDEADYTPVVIRQKEFDPEWMTADEAVDRMELVGHDFFLFIDATTDRPSVVYRRKGWDYGVIALAVTAPPMVEVLAS